jgi:hypothetical protein
MKTPERRAPGLVVTHGDGRLFVQTLLPRDATVSLHDADLYTLDGTAYPPERDTGPAPACRVEVSPPAPSARDLFLHVLTATAASVENTAAASLVVEEGTGTLTLRLGVADARLDLASDGIGGTLELGGKRYSLSTRPPGR